MTKIWEGAVTVPIDLELVDVDFLLLIILTEANPHMSVCDVQLK